VEKAEKVEELALALYTKVNSWLFLADDQAAEYAETRGIIIADTKFEFGETEMGEIILIDEVLTPGITPSDKN
jgi:phosphoribosylaminoimidazole-succinocarboxamide synthase